MTNQEAIEKFKKIKRGNIFLIHQRCEGKEVIEDYSLCDIAISALQAQDLQQSYNNLATDSISRQAAIDAPFKKWDMDNGVTWIPLEHIEQLPSAQSEIIRCKDCRWCEEREDSIDKTPYWMCRIWDGETDADGFCHEAERRTDE